MTKNSLLKKLKILSITILKTMKINKKVIKPYYRKIIILRI